MEPFRSGKSWSICQLAQQDGGAGIREMHHRIAAHEGRVGLELDGEVVVETAREGAFVPAISRA